MKAKRFAFKEHFKKYRIEIRHVTILFVVLLIFQILVSLIYKFSLQSFLVKTQDWYRQDSAERLANLTTTSLELLFETRTWNQKLSEIDKRHVVQAFNIIISQQILYQNVQELCILVPHDSGVVAIDDGQVLYAYYFENLKAIPPPQMIHTDALQLYSALGQEIKSNEQIRTVQVKQSFHIFVPFVPRGEYSGAVYMRITPDFSFIAGEVISSYDKVAITFFALIIMGLLAMYYLSSYTLKERNKTQALLFEEQKLRLAEQINHHNEMLFTKRIYHTHHKAEKVMGFIKEDLRQLTNGNTVEIKNRVTKYSNFVSRVIYDMKWYDPMIHTTRNAIFKTNVNDVIRFMVEHVFKRVSRNSEAFAFKLELDDRLLDVPINEFVIWEVLDPIIQNSLDHAGVDQVLITIRTTYFPELKQSILTITDNGRGILPELLAENEKGIKRIFVENTTTKKDSNQHSGYGCYIAYEIAKQRCGWDLQVENLPQGGCQFTFVISHLS